MNAFRVFFQWIYYWKFYLKVIQIGHDIKLSSGGRFVHPENIIMGNNIFISNHFHISAHKLIFENNIIIGPNLIIECTNHIVDIIGKTMYEIAKQKIGNAVTIENDVWVGANVTILSGVKISEGCVVGAGSVVTKTIPPYTICVGVPCKPIKKRFSDSDMKRHLDLIKTSKYQLDNIYDQWRLYNL